MNLPERIAKARKAKGLSQAELAKKLGVSAGTVAGWETTGSHAHGMRDPMKKRVAKVLGVEVAELLA